MKILLTGASGQVGWELARTLLPLGSVNAPPHAALDLAEPQTIAPVIETMHPDVIVNAAAYTAVDNAESEAGLAQRINAAAPAELAAAAKRSGAMLVHDSTDYVFDGMASQPYREDDATGPLGEYGRSKLAGEQAIAASGCDHLIFRTSWVYAARGKNFLRTMLRLAAEREQLRVVSDQIGAPTWARLIAETTAFALRQEIAARQAARFNSELLHLTASGETSWHGFASAIVRNAQARGMALKCTSIAPITTAEYPLPAPRPGNSRLSCRRLEERYNLRMPGWETCLERVMEELS